MAGLEADEGARWEVGRVYGPQRVRARKHEALEVGLLENVANADAPPGEARWWTTQVRAPFIFILIIFSTDNYTHIFFCVVAAAGGGCDESAAGARQQTSATGSARAKKRLVGLQPATASVRCATHLAATNPAIRPTTHLIPKQSGRVHKYWKIRARPVITSCAFVVSRSGTRAARSAGTNGFPIKKPGDFRGLRCGAPRR